MILSLLSVGVAFFALGAPFVAALEVIIYAGAIMVLFVFVVMMLNLGPQAIEQERRWLSPRWQGAVTLAVILVAELALLLALGGARPPAGEALGPKQVGMSLFGPYLLGVELASFLLLAGLVGAYHLGRKDEGGRMKDEKRGEVT